MTHDADGGRSALADGVRACVRARLGGHLRALRRRWPGPCSSPAGAPAPSSLVRVGGAALLVAPFAAVALRGQWGILRRNAGLIVTYGVLAVAGAQFCYFSAVSHMQVGPALLIEYTAPAAVVVWLWLRHGQRPGPVTLVGAGLAALGLVLVLDLLSGADLSVPGVLWALAAMVGAAAYFVISADESNGLPPMALAAGGLVVGALALAAARAGRPAADAPRLGAGGVRRRGGRAVGAAGAARRW